MKDRIYYFFDPLCGWCYGFSPVVKRLNEELGDKFQFAALTGGMIRNSSAQPLSEMSAYIKGAYKTVERHCNVQFGQPFLDLLDQEDVWFGSEPPSLAFVIMKHLVKDHDVELAGKFVSLISNEGKRPGVTESYRGIVESYGIDFTEFMELYNSDKMKQLMEDEFEVTANLGISGFPALVLEKDKKLFLLASGARTYDDVMEQLRKLGYQLD